MVDSAVLRMTVREEPLLPLLNQAFFQGIVRAAFGQRRKTLVNNLKGSALLRQDEGHLVEVLRILGIDGKRRGETLSVEEFGRLSNALFSIKQNA
jgi:16S rRNA (adenine1518-N6/adenine1519-N6)-dimethyltransferase